jgi:hypothetical protein
VDLKPEEFSYKLPEKGRAISISSVDGGYDTLAGV